MELQLLLGVWNMKPAIVAAAFRVISSCHIFRMGFSHLLSWSDLWLHHQSLQIYQKHKDVASPLIFGPSPLFASRQDCRLVGVGEASFISLAAPFIINVAPPAQSSAWLALFYMCIPVGIALVYVFGGLVGPWAGIQLSGLRVYLCFHLQYLVLCKNEFISKEAWRRLYWNNLLM
ncbi:hypothetical protein CY35_11G092600 [Sphagnum magellanicum]|nr:hypothetical protein CY35_11G092600 [Sphagnum magellanicum]